MSGIFLPGNGSLPAALAALQGAGGLSGTAPLVIAVPEGGFVPCETIAFLAAWGQLQVQQDRRLDLRGDDGYLARMNLHRVLGLAEPQHGRRSEEGRFLPLYAVGSIEEMDRPIEAIAEIVRQQLPEPESFLPALDWIMGEVLENIFNHAESPVPGVVCAQFFPNKHRLDLAICDVGRGLRASLAGSRPVYSHGHAIELAIERGVTSSDSAGRGNGLAGTLEITKRNKAKFRIWSGDMLFTADSGKDKGFVQIPLIPGTGVALSLDTRSPVDLQQTWIASLPSYRPRLIPAVASAGPADARIPVRDAQSTRARAGATPLRQRATTAIDGPATRVVFDFEGVSGSTSSFMDELLGVLAGRLGSDELGKRIATTGASSVLQGLAETAVRRRLGLADDEEPEG